jgi:hypothetical protein
VHLVGFYSVLSDVTRAVEREWLKNLDTELERITLSCTATGTWSERVKLYNRQVIILPRNTKVK